MSFLVAQKTENEGWGEVNQGKVARKTDFIFQLPSECNAHP